MLRQRAANRRWFADLFQGTEDRKGAASLENVFQRVCPLQPTQRFNWSKKKFEVETVGFHGLYLEKHQLAHQWREIGAASFQSVVLLDNHPNINAWK